MRVGLLVAIALLVAAPRVELQTRAAARAGAGLVAERVAVMDRALQRYVDEGRVAGLVAVVMRHGRVEYEKAFGWADKEAGRPMSADTLFRIASQSKAFTSVAVLQLVEEGRLALGTPASAFVRSFGAATVAIKDDRGLTTVPARRPITIRDLLSHTAGLSYGTDPIVADLYAAKGLGPAAGFGWYTADKDEAICDTMERLGTLPLVAQPGEAWVYGYNTDVLGCIVERASGVTLDEYVRTRIAAPLGLTDTHFFVPAEKRPRLAAVYASADGGGFVRAPEGARGQGHYVDGPRRSFSGGAGLVSTAREYARFLEALRRGGTLAGARILGERSVKLMTTNQVGTLHSTTGLGFGLGFETVDRYGANGLSGEGAWGWGGAYGSLYRVDPDAGVVMTLMIQLLPNATDLREVFPTLVYQALGGKLEAGNP